MHKHLKTNKGYDLNEIEKVNTPVFTNICNFEHVLVVHACFDRIIILRLQKVWKAFDVNAKVMKSTAIYFVIFGSETLHVKQA